MSLFKKHRLNIATTVYWVLLAYIIALLTWWFIALQSQNKKMTDYRLQELKMDSPLYERQVQEIQKEQELETARNVGEGSTFLILILVAAIYVYREVRRQIRLQLQQQNFMMAVTHELKTPIAITKLNLETLQKHRLDEQKQQKIIQTSLQELGRLDTLANNILIASQLEGGGYHQEKEELDFSALVTQTVLHGRQRFPDREWKTQIEPDLSLIGDTLLLQLLVNNLEENALKYSPKTGVITVSLEKKGTHVVFSVKDEGPGVSDEEKKKVFNKFYRSGSEKTRTAPGTGLGLYLCRKIAEDHRASIKVTDNSPVGSIFTVTF
jgi:two-component system sensor histidine kinase CiaH